MQWALTIPMHSWANRITTLLIQFSLKNVQSPKKLDQVNQKISRGAENPVGKQMSPTNTTWFLLGLLNMERETGCRWSSHLQSWGGAAAGQPCCRGRGFATFLRNTPEAALELFSPIITTAFKFWGQLNRCSNWDRWYVRPPVVFSGGCGIWRQPLREAVESTSLASWGHWCLAAPGRRSPWNTACPVADRLRPHRCHEGASNMSQAYASPDWWSFALYPRPAKPLITNPKFGTTSACLGSMLWGQWCSGSSWPRGKGSIIFPLVSKLLLGRWLFPKLQKSMSKAERGTARSHKGKALPSLERPERKLCCQTKQIWVHSLAWCAAETNADVGIQGKKRVGVYCRAPSKGNGWLMPNSWIPRRIPAGVFKGKIMKRWQGVWSACAHCLVGQWWGDRVVSGGLVISSLVPPGLEPMCLLSGGGSPGGGLNSCKTSQGHIVQSLPVALRGK